MKSTSFLQSRSTADGAGLLFVDKVRDEVKLVLSKKEFWQLLNPVQTQFHDQRRQDLFVNEIRVHNVQGECRRRHMLHAGMLTGPHPVLLRASSNGPIGHPHEWMSLVLGIEFL